MNQLYLSAIKDIIHAHYVYLEKNNLEGPNLLIETTKVMLDDIDCMLRETGWVKYKDDILEYISGEDVSSFSELSWKDAFDFLLIMNHEMEWPRTEKQAKHRLLKSAQL